MGWNIQDIGGVPMKKSLLSILLLITFVLHWKGSFANGTQSNDVVDQFEKEKMVIEHLLNERSKIWNKMYEDEDGSNQWMNELKNVVSKPLLDFDIESFLGAKACPTDMDKVIDLKVLEIDDVSYTHEGMEARITVNWKMQGFTSRYEEEVDYEVILIKENDIWKLCDYQITQ